MKYRDCGILKNVHTLQIRTILIFIYKKITALKSFFSGIVYNLCMYYYYSISIIIMYVLVCP